MLIHAGADFLAAFHQLLGDIWAKGSVVDDWRNAVVVPVPKKGDLRCCDNWRGISLLNVAGKLFARVMQDRLQVVAEEILPDSQCGFRRGRGCTDMIFCARQLVEKTIEHDTSLYVLFVDLQKAYNSIPRTALWSVLDRLGVPPVMLGLIKSLHEGMIAKVRVNGKLSDNISVTYGLRQGCTQAPTLFNLYFSVVVADWRARCPDAGVDLLFRNGHKLVGDRTAKSRLSATRVTESQFADDAALYATTRERFERMTSEFILCAQRWGLTVSIRKTKGMAVGQPTSVDPVQLGGDSRIDMVTGSGTLAACSLLTVRWMRTSLLVWRRRPGCSACSVLRYFSAYISRSTPSGWCIVLSSFLLFSTLRRHGPSKRVIFADSTPFTITVFAQFSVSLVVSNGRRDCRQHRLVSWQG